MTNKIVAIHQPNFFPWLGFFDKLIRCDVFVLLDDVQFPKTGGTWMNRVKLLSNGSPIWVTAPIVRAYHGTRRISEIQINEATPWREKLVRTVYASYAQTPYFRELFQVFEPLILNSAHSLLEYNHFSIETMAGLFGIDTQKIVLGSSLNVSSHSTDMLVEMTRAVGGTAYLSGDGAGGYQEAEKFAQAGLALMFQNYTHPLYKQIRSEKFVAGLSVLDALFHVGLERVREILSRSAQRENVN